MMTEKERLKDNVEVKQKKLRARLAELKADSRSKAMEERKELEAKLEELSQALREGWENLSEKTASKLNHWLGRN